MAKVETVALRRFLDPVNEAGQERRKASQGMESIAGMTTRKRNQVLRAFEKADIAYAEAVGELIGGVTKLVEDAEAEAEEQQADQPNGERSRHGP